MTILATSMPLTWSSIKCLFGVLIQNKKHFSLNVLNERIRSFPYGSDVTDHPKQIPPAFLTSTSSNATKQCGECVSVCACV